MSNEIILNKLKESIAEMDRDMAVEAANEAIAAGMDPLVCIDKGLSAGMQIMSDLFDDGEAFVPELVESSEAFNAAVAVLTESMSDEDKKAASAGIAVVYTVQGDIHDIGKNIVRTLFEANNFEIYDLGRDVAAELVLEKAEEVGAQVILGSALMTTTMPSQRGLIELLKSEGVREKYFVMFGGAPVTNEWVVEIGGDAYTETATEAVTVAKEYLGK